MQLVSPYIPIPINRAPLTKMGIGLYCETLISTNWANNQRRIFLIIKMNFESRKEYILGRRYEALCTKFLWHYRYNIPHQVIFSEDWMPGNYLYATCVTWKRRASRLFNKHQCQDIRFSFHLPKIKKRKRKVILWSWDSIISENNHASLTTQWKIHNNFFIVLITDRHCLP